ncbi:heme exporter protein CcmB [Litorimonas sp. RW-G-Af-16]|uniref:heme exporter protein CcmB n=1 Tax=Litorimonas sp. RW-G-Af-16 TaxID=3241168 RepID=UPI00390C94E1
MRAIIARDIKLAMRAGGHWALGLIFFALFLALCGIALGGQLSTLSTLAVPLTWLAFIFSALLSVPQIFRGEMEDGSLAQFKLAGTGMGTLAAAKLVSFTVITLLPLIIMVPLLAQMFGVSGGVIAGLMLSLLIGLPAVTFYMGVSAALLCGRQSGGFLTILLTAPLLIPTLIFGVAAANAFPDFGWAASELRILLGLSLISVALGFPAIIAALSANLEQS